jgi:hypothetical protein
MHLELPPQPLTEPKALHELMHHSSMQLTMDFYANVDSTLQGAIGRLA